MNYWLIADTHLNHQKLTEWGGRTGNWQEQILKGLHTIPAGDVLIHLGDFCMGSDEECMKLFSLALHSDVKRILVRGNHDKKSANWYVEHGFDFVCDQIGLEFHGVDLLLSHRPMPADTWRWKYNIHGHTHGNMHRSEEYEGWYTPAFNIDISPEIVGYKPLRLDTLMKKYKV